MKLIFLGDIFGRPGCYAVKNNLSKKVSCHFCSINDSFLPKIKTKKAVKKTKSLLYLKTSTRDDKSNPLKIISWKVV